MRGDVELTKNIGTDHSPKGTSCGFQFSQSCVPFPLLPVTPGCLLGLQHPLLAITVLSGFVSTSQLAFEASLLARSHFSTLC